MVAARFDLGEEQYGALLLHFNIPLRDFQNPDALFSLNRFKVGLSWEKIMIRSVS